MLKRCSGNKKIGWIVTAIVAAISIALEVANKLIAKEQARKARRAFDRAKENQIKLILKNNGVDIELYENTFLYLPRFVQNRDGVISQESENNDTYTAVERKMYDVLADTGKKTAVWFSPIYTKGFTWGKTTVGLPPLAKYIKDLTPYQYNRDHIAEFISNSGLKTVQFYDMPLMIPNFTHNGVVFINENNYKTMGAVDTDKFAKDILTSGGYAKIPVQYMRVLKMWLQAALQLVQGGVSMNDLLVKIAKEANNLCAIYPGDVRYIKGLFNVFVDIIKDRKQLTEKEVKVLDEETYIDFDFKTNKSINYDSAVAWAYDIMESVRGDVKFANGNLVYSSLDDMFRNAYQANDEPARRVRMATEKATDDETVPVMVKSIITDITHGVDVTNPNDDYKQLLEHAQELEAAGADNKQLDKEIRTSKEKETNTQQKQVVDYTKGGSGGGGNRALLFDQKQETAGFGTIAIIAAVLLGGGYLLNSK